MPAQFKLANTQAWRHEGSEQVTLIKKDVPKCWKSQKQAEAELCQY